MRLIPAVAQWAKTETTGADCGDARLNRRLGTLLTALGQAPSASIPEACNGAHAEIAAAYRFFDNPATTPQCILAAHRSQSLQRMEGHASVLLVQDTTEVDMSQPQRRIRGAGPLDDSARQGARLHLMHAFSPEGTPLGSVWHKIIVRDERPAPDAAPARKSRSQRQSMPIEQKESMRWIEGLAAANALARERAQLRLICVADSEADIYEYLSHIPRQTQEAQGRPNTNTAHWIVRACQDRALLEEESADAQPPTVWAACEQAPVLWQKALHVRGRKGKVACDKRARRQPRLDRDAIVAVRAVEQIALRAPYRKGRRLPAVKVNAVLVREEAPPEGEVAVEWLLLTSLPVQNAGQVRQVVEAYSQRFMIEVFFRVLKSGCRIEERRFESADRHLSHLALALIIAWRVLWLSQLGQHQPERDAAEVFTASEWQSAWAVIKRGQPLPPQAPSVGEMIKIVGKLGGWIERGAKSASPPGVQTLWQGLQRLHDLSTAWNICHP
jgi:Transposase DNA-binding/Transposase Tn5 dimerisation domain